MLEHSIDVVHTHVLDRQVAAAFDAGTKLARVTNQEMFPWRHAVQPFLVTDGAQQACARSYPDDKQARPTLFRPGAWIT